MLFKNSVRTSKRTPHFTITKINWLTLFKEIIVTFKDTARVTPESTGTVPCFSREGRTNSAQCIKTGSSTVREDGVKIYCLTKSAETLGKIRKGKN